MDRLIIASNRLPVKIFNEAGVLKLEASAGGLATGLKSYHKGNNSVWLGWPGIGASTAIEKKEITKMLANEQCIPIFLEDELIENYYDGFSNATLWPLFHYFTEYTSFKEVYWHAYVKVNEMFADEIIKNASKGDTVWVHDYQLLLVPNLVKSKRPDIRIGFFLHIPFPSYEVFRILPWREEILHGVLGADLIGFHTYDYARHFISSVKRLLGCDIDFNTISLENRQVYVDVFPMGIDFDKFYEKSLEIQSRPIQERSKEHQDIDRFLLDTPERKIIFSSDRLDYTKGIPERLKAYKKFLEDHPEFKEQVSLVLQVVPSRVDVEQYQNLKSEIDELISSINGEFGTLNWNPIIYFYRSLPFDNLIELFSSSEIALLTPLRDGMNLVAKEFIATKNNQRGVLILSEMAGATKELGEAILVNPNNINDVAEAIYKALTMKIEDQTSAIQSMQKRIKRYNVHKWASEFVTMLDKTVEKQAIHQARKVSDELIDRLSKMYHNSTKKLLFLDYDGTLQRFFNNPEDAKPDKELLELLDTIKADVNADLVLISGRDKNTLNNWFGNKGISLIAEHGVWFKVNDSEWIERNQSASNWKESIRPILESYVDRTPGSLIEEKSHSLVWHYRKSDIELGILRALELTTDISTLIINQDLEILEGSKVIEIKVAGINKGSAAIDYMQGGIYDFIIAIGDDWTDEYLFKELPDKSITIKVGTARSEAKYYVDNYQEVRQLLNKMIK
jgi:trehalose 6-phosphate synthase/phosphatase